MSRTARVLGAVVVPAVSIPLATSAMGSGGAPAPPSKTLPAQLDVASPYLPQTICDPPAKPGVTAFARLMARHYSRFNYGISRHCNAGLTEHSEGRALDWMLNAYNPSDRAIADSVVAWLVAPDRNGQPGAMARRFGIMYIIWDRKIWGTYNMKVGWRPYNGASPHTDHIHFSFSWDGAMGRTSWWTGKAWTSVTRTPGGTPGPIVTDPSTPPPTTPKSYPTLRVGSSGPDVVLAQKVVGVQADGRFGPATKAAVERWQRAQKLTVNGAVDQATWRRMVALGDVPARGGMPSLARYFKQTIRQGSSGSAVTAAQKALKITADGKFGPATAAAVRRFQESKSLTVNGVVSENVWKALAGLPYTKTGKTKPPAKPPTTPAVPTIRTSTEYTPLKSQVIAKGSRGAAVRTLQRGLGTVAVDGAFGSGTERAVRTFQRKHKIKVTGVVDAKTWDALERDHYPFLKYRKTVLRPGASGYTVKVLQTYLGVRPDGSFGSATVEAVKALQGRSGIARTGVVGGLTWQALEKERTARRAA